jgi:quercetin dioxygenase-like cupin family protein
MEMVIPPQGGPPPHIHSREVESFYILEGSLSFWLSDRKLSAVAGSLIIAPPGLTHTFKNEGDAPARVLLLITPAGLEKFFQELGIPIKEGSPVSEPPASEDLEQVAITASKYGIDIKSP